MGVVEGMVLGCTLTMIVGMPLGALPLIAVGAKLRKGVGITLIVGIILGTNVGTIVGLPVIGALVTGMALGDPRKISVGEVICDPIQYMDLRAEL